MRTPLTAVVVVGLLGLLGYATPGLAQSEAYPALDRDYSWPHDGPLLELFDPGDSPYGPGHRGIDIAVLPEDPVRAVADGVVTFAGSVVGTTWVTIEHQPGLLSTIGDLANLAVAAGDTVVRGEVIGITTGAVHDDVPGIHVSFRWQQQYIDPLEVLPARRDRGPSLVGSGGWWAGEPSESSTAGTSSAASSGAAIPRPHFSRHRPSTLATRSGVGHLPAGRLASQPT